MGLHVPNLLQFSLETQKIDTEYGQQGLPSSNISFKHLLRMKDILNRA